MATNQITTPAEYLKALELHNWEWRRIPDCYRRSFKNSIKGWHYQNQNKLEALAVNNPQFQQLLDAYKAYKAGSGPKPTLPSENPKADLIAAYEEYAGAIACHLLPMAA